MLRLLGRVLIQVAMSALPQLADSRLTPPEVREVPQGDICSATSDTLLDHFVGAQKQRRRDYEADCSSGFEVERKFKGRCLFNGEIGWRRTTQDLHEQPCHLSVHRRDPCTITDQPAVLHDFWQMVDRR